MGWPIFFKFCVTTRLRNLMIYPRRLLNIFSRFLYTEGSNLPYSISCLFVHNSPLYVWFQVFSVVYLFACVSVFICMKSTVCIVRYGIVEFNVPLDTVLGHFGDGSTVCNFNPWSGWVITESMSLYHQSLHLASNCIVVVIVSLCCILVDTNKQHCSAGT